MNKIKNTYSAPEADLLVVRFEQNIMSVNSVSSKTGGEYFLTGDGEGYYDEL